MISRKQLLFAGLTALAIAGCGSPAPAVSQTQAAATQQQSALSAKLNGMSPAARTAYIRDHMAEATSAAAAGIPGAAGASVKTR